MEVTSKILYLKLIRQLNNIEITSLYTDHHDAYCIERAKQLKVMVHINEPKDFENKGEYEQN